MSSLWRYLHKLIKTTLAVCLIGLLATATFNHSRKYWKTGNSPNLVQADEFRQEIQHVKNVSKHMNEHESEDNQPGKIPAKINRPLPHGVCRTYAELRDVNFLHSSLKDRICKGASAYSITDSTFPLCELQQQLPQSLAEPVKAGSFQSHIRSPVTKRNVPCFVYTGSDLISNAIRKQHIFEERNVEMMQRIIRTLNSIAPVTFLDIGSNIGVFTLAALDIGVPVVALDANIRNLMRIRLSADSSDLANKPRLLWNFISSQVSLMYLNFPADCNMGGATKFGRAVADTIPVMATTGDSIASTVTTRTIVMKVDIEGGEAEFFKSSQGLFASFTIPVVHMEWLRRHMTADERQFMVAFFKSRNYSPRSMQQLSRRINVEDSNFEGEDLVWLREDLLQNGTLTF